MRSNENAPREGAAPGCCGVGREGLKCAPVSWIMPLVAAVTLAAALRHPALAGFNILFVVFGVTALLRSLAHIRVYGGCGLGGHVALGAALNLVIVVLVVIYSFTALDPLQLRR